MTRIRFADQDGFTLLEILLAIFLISILSAIAITSYKGISYNAKTAVTEERMQAIKIGIIGDGSMHSGGIPTKLGFELNCLGLPSSLGDLTAQPGTGDPTTTGSTVCDSPSTYSPYTKQGWRGPYVSTTDSSWDKDGWGNSIVYDSGARTLTSNPPNGTAITVNF